jgi:hypothetical protein
MNTGPNRGATVDDEQDGRRASEHDLDNHVTKNLNGGGEGRHRRPIASRLKELEQLIQRVLIERRYHRLRDVAEEVVDSETRTRKGFTQ